MTGPAPHPHGERELCEPGLTLYTEALTAGRIARSALGPAPCLVGLALLLPDPRDAAWLRPVPPSAALARLLDPLSREIDARLRLATALTRSLMPLAATAGDDPNRSITVLEGRDRIRAALRNASRSAREEVLTAQPGGNRMATNMRQGLANAEYVIAAGGRLRHLYQHPARYSPRLREYLTEIPSGRLQIRTMEQSVGRLLIFDRETAYIPADPDSSTALEIRHPALVRYLADVYETLWAVATPFTESLPTAVPGAPATAVQLSIARLLVEGYADQAVAEKLGISVRTCRAHISRLMRTLGATSRTHLGALLVRSDLAEPAR
ncbi:LuxR C-terminal-related transcriptional regulator [Streptomyces sp. ATexAB-D23]|uniref:LuxR C-terminal-related transcriptional regulator n=1 Tax=unclassified Streptomyces TaxID=2593676 RepID=UPI00036A1AAD|nr:LuxR C-terminal-related transcriptional regulator [Streptomyces sp. ATexAB-D23]MYY03383.1 helix-turn-helix transcriptional regulator [Streptomyces sp. SID4913]